MPSGLVVIETWSDTTEMVITGWPLSRQCKIPWQFSDGLRHSWPC